MDKEFPVPWNAATALLMAVLALPLASCTSVFQPVDQSAPKSESPCGDGDEAEPSPFEYDNVKDLLAEILSDRAAVVEDIDGQVKRHVKDEREKPVTVELEICPRDTFIVQYARDRAGADTEANLRRRAGEIFDSLAGFTYTSNERNDDGVQKIKIKLFCKSTLAHIPFGPHTDIDRIQRLILHELVHAKLYAMELLGVAQEELPFRDHDDDPANDETEPFFREVERLFDLLARNTETDDEDEEAAEDDEEEGGQ